MLIVFGSIFFICILASTLYTTRNRKLAILAKPDNGDVYKVFEVTIDNTVYYVIKHYIYIRETCGHVWNLFANYSYYKNMSKNEVIELCDRLNEEHKNVLYEKKMNIELEKK
jgi:hypothetical protein